MHSEQEKAKVRQKRRRERVRSCLRTNQRLRLSVHRSNKYIYAQLVDVQMGKTLFGLSTKMIKEAKNRTEAAKALGEKFVALCQEKKVDKIVFDRGAYKFHGQVKAFAGPISKQNLLA